MARKKDLTWGRINDILDFVYPSDEVERKINGMWRQMFVRCLDKTCKSYPYYKDSNIHPSLYYKSNLLKWFMSEPRWSEFVSHPELHWCIDKDMKCPGNKNYYPEYMTLTTQSDNSKERHKRNPNNKVRAILAISLDKKSKFLFKSFIDTTSKGFNKGNVYRCCEKVDKYKSHKGYKWYYLNYKHPFYLRKI